MSAKKKSSRQSPSRAETKSKHAQKARVYFEKGQAAEAAGEDASAAVWYLKTSQEYMKAGAKTRALMWLRRGKDLQRPEKAREMGTTYQGPYPKKHAGPKRSTYGKSVYKLTRRSVRRDPGFPRSAGQAAGVNPGFAGARRDPMTVANTILEQLGGRHFIAMTGAKNISGESPTSSFGGSLRFKIPKAKNGITVVLITLDPNDTYTVRFIKQARAPSFAVTTVKEYDNIYADQLADLFTRTTGLYTRL